MAIRLARSKIPGLVVTTTGIGRTGEMNDCEQNIELAFAFFPYLAECIKFEIEIVGTEREVTILGAMENQGDAVLERVAEAKNTLVECVLDMGSSVEGVVVDKVTEARDAVNDHTKFAVTAGANAVADHVDGGFEAAKEHVDGGFEAMKEQFDSGFAESKKEVTELKEDVKEMKKMIGLLSTPARGRPVSEIGSVRGSIDGHFNKLDLAFWSDRGALDVTDVDAEQFSEKVPIEDAEQQQRGRDASSIPPRDEEKDDAKDDAALAIEDEIEALLLIDPRPNDDPLLDDAPPDAVMAPPVAALVDPTKLMFAEKKMVVRRPSGIETRGSWFRYGLQDGVANMPTLPKLSKTVFVSPSVRSRPQVHANARARQHDKSAVGVPGSPRQLAPLTEADEAVAAAAVGPATAAAAMELQQRHRGAAAP